MNILTHSGTFHADEVTAIAILLVLYPESAVERTRDEERIKEAQEDENTIVVDVGHEFDQVMFNFDHHQRDFKHNRINKNPYSSAGLIWEVFGPALLNKKFPNMSANALMKAWDFVDQNFIQEVDRIDNGIFAPGSESTYSSIISDLNPIPLLEENDESGWHQALIFADSRLERMCLTGVMQSRMEQIWGEKRMVAGGRAVELSTYIPFSKLSVALPDTVLYVVFPRDEGDWFAQQIPIEEGSGDGRKPFPEAWRGLENKYLAQVCDVPDAIFCAASGFCAIAGSRESIIRMVQMAAEV